MGRYKGKKVIFSPHVHMTTTKEEQTKTVALSMASGDQEVSPDLGKVLSKVTITKPDTLIAGNIKNGVTIGGVTGSLDTPEETYQGLLSETFGS